MKTKVDSLWANMVGSFFHEERNSEVENTEEGRRRCVRVCVSVGVCEYGYM